MCQGAVWQEEDIAHITFYLKNTNQLHSVPSVPYQAQNSSGLLHWKVLCILLDIPDIHRNIQQTNKTILIMVSSESFSKKVVFFKSDFFKNKVLTN